MHDNDSIDDMVTKFTKITDDFASLGDAINNDQKVRKVICVLSPSWEVKALIGSLKTHEMEMKVRKKMAPQKKKMIAFKSTPTISDIDNEEEDDEELSLLAKNVRRMYNKAKFNNRRRW